MVVLIVALEAGTSEGDGLRAELGELKVSQLKRRASALAVAQDAIDEADDAPSIKQALIELIVRASLAASGAPSP